MCRSDMVPDQREFIGLTKFFGGRGMHESVWVVFFAVDWCVFL